MRERIVEGGGEVVKNTGDGFFASFDDPKAAVDAAIAIQRALDDEIVAPDVRIGAHSGGAFRTGRATPTTAARACTSPRGSGRPPAPARSWSAARRSTASAAAFRLSEPRAENLKGFEEPVEVVAVDWR